MTFTTIHYIEKNRVTFVLRLFHMNKISSWNKIHLAHFCSFNMLEKLKDGKVENSKLVNNWNMIFYHLVRVSFSLSDNYGFRFFGMVMTMWLGTSLYRHLQCSGSRFLNQVTFVEEDEEEIVVVDVIVPHSDAAEILHVKWWDSTVYTCGKEGKWKMKRVGS